MEKKIYQIEVRNQNNEWEVPEPLYSWVVFHSEEEANAWAKSNLDTKDYVVKEYDTDDIEGYSYVNPKTEDFKVFNIEWDTDDEDAEELGLPNEMIVEVSENYANLDCIVEVEDYLSDHISDLTGYCHLGFDYEKINQ